MLMKKFSTTATSEKISELEENIKEEEEKQADKDGVEKLIQMVELVKTSCDCFDDHVAKECYWEDREKSREVRRSIKKVKPTAN